MIIYHWPPLIWISRTFNNPWGVFKYIYKSFAFDRTMWKRNSNEKNNTKMFVHIYPTPPLGQDMTRGQFLSGVDQVWFQNFSSLRLVASPRLKNLVCPTILAIAGGRIIGFIPFPRVLVKCEMQSVTSRIWTRVAVSISYDDNHYTMGTSTKMYG